MNAPLPCDKIDDRARRSESRQLASRPLARVSVLVAAVVIAVAGCGSSSDPGTWEEAEEHGFTDPETGEEFNSAVEFNFMSTCRPANSEGSGGDLNAESAQVLCRCTFDGLRASLTLQEFKDLDKAFRETPNPNHLDDEPEDVWEDRAEEIYDACASRVDG